uniref:Oxidative stress induced growth inhibitor 1 n=1 Tax=Oryctolagus cuniculus TaxID=9986 RepID=A0A5F9CZZ2_RABIT
MSSSRKDRLSSPEPLPVVIIGNGPSGICLSYLLSGYTPYVRPDAVHPHPLLQRKLAEAPGVSILDQVGQSSAEDAPLWEPPPAPTCAGKHEEAPGTRAPRHTRVHATAGSSAPQGTRFWLSPLGGAAGPSVRGARDETPIPCPWRPRSSERGRGRSSGWCCWGLRGRGACWAGPLRQRRHPHA